MMRSSLLIPVAVLLAACGGEEDKSEPKAPDASAPQATTMPDSTTKAADTMPATTGTAKAASPAKKAEGPLRDSAFGPKFMVDSTGKVTKIRPEEL